ALTLRAVDELGEVTSRALSTVVAVSPATMTNVLDRLEAKTLIERYRSTVDRRIVHVRLTDDGQAILGTMPNLMDETFMLRFADLPAARRTQISTALREVAQMMNADATDAAPADNGQSSTPA
ncbi:MAG: MarR family transcriptional regulator, partial [Pseudomonadota bacterium]